MWCGRIAGWRVTRGGRAPMHLWQRHKERMGAWVSLIAHGAVAETAGQGLQDMGWLVLFSRGTCLPRLN